MTGNAAAGEGTVAALAAALNGETVPVITTDAQGRTISSSFGWISPSTAVIEMSAASGLALVADLPLRPRTASTFGCYCDPAAACASTRLVSHRVDALDGTADPRVQALAR